VDPEAPLLDGYVRPNLIDEFLLRDDLTWAVGKINQNIERPTAEGKYFVATSQDPFPA
jgi:predicted nucleic-acid-binding protein